MSDHLVTLFIFLTENRALMQVKLTHVLNVLVSNFYFIKFCSYLNI